MPGIGTGALRRRSLSRRRRPDGPSIAAPRARAPRGPVAFISVARQGCREIPDRFEDSVGTPFARRRSEVNFEVRNDGLDGQPPDATAGLRQPAPGRTDRCLVCALANEGNTAARPILDMAMIVGLVRPIPTAGPAARIADVHAEHRRPNEIDPDDQEIASPSRTGKHPEHGDIPRFQHDGNRSFAKRRLGFNDPELDDRAAEPAQRRPATEYWQATLEPAQQLVARSDVSLGAERKPEHDDKDQPDRDGWPERLKGRHARNDTPRNTRREPRAALLDWAPTPATPRGDKPWFG
jgi:hypothetical protein